MFSNPNHAIRQVFEEKDHKAMSAIWEKIEKRHGQSKIMPQENDCYDRLRPVFEGKFVLFADMSGMDCSENLKYSSPDGKKFVIIDRDEGEPNIAKDH